MKQLSLVRTFRLESLEKKIIYFLIFVAFVVVNLVVSYFPLRLDLSRGRAYTLSGSSQKVLQRLDDLVTITFYASSDLPTRLLPVKTDVVDLLNEYKKEGGKNIQLKVVNPKRDPKLATEAEAMGIPQLQFSQLEQDKYALANGFFGIGITYGTKKGAIPQATDLENLEYNLTSTIYKLTNKKLPVVGIVGGVDPATGQNRANALQKILDQQVEVRSLSLPSTKGEDPFKGVASVILFDNPGSSYGATALSAVKEYLNQKGKMLVLTDGVVVEDNLSVSEKKSNLDSVLTPYGLKVDNNLVLSMTAEMVNFGNSQVSFFVPYPFWPKTNVFNPTVPYFANVSQLTYPWTSSVVIQKKSGYEYAELVKTTKNSWQQKGSFALTPQQIPQPKENEFKSYVLAAEVKNKKGMDIVLIPSSRFADDRFQSQTAGNDEFLANVVGSMASGGALSGIRSRGVNIYPLPQMSSETKDIFKYVTIFLLPVLFGLYGVGSLSKRFLPKKTQHG